MQQAPPWINTEPVTPGAIVRVDVAVGVRVNVGAFVDVRVAVGAFFVAVRVDMRTAAANIDFWLGFTPAAKTCETSPAKSNNKTTIDVINNLDLILFSFQINGRQMDLAAYRVIVHNTDLNYTGNAMRCVALF